MGILRLRSGVADYHVHLSNALSVEQAVTVAKERGVQIGIVEHPGPGYAINTDTELKQYIDGLRKYPVRVGLQPVYTGWSKNFSQNVLDQLDYVLMDALTLPRPDGGWLAIWQIDTMVDDEEEFMKGYMKLFKSSRVVHEYTQSNPAPPGEVFPLLCPVREAEWVPGWEYRLIYSDSGIAELGCVFTTPTATSSASAQAPERQNSPRASGPASETTWVTVEYDPLAYRIGYVWVNPGLVVAELRIQLEAAGDDSTRSHIGYRYTGLSPEGNREVERYDRQWFERKMHRWEEAINCYLQTGRKIDAAAWE